MSFSHVNALEPFELDGWGQLSKSILQDYYGEKSDQFTKLIFMNCSMLYALTVVFNEAFTLYSWLKAAVTHGQLTACQSRQRWPSSVSTVLLVQFRRCKFVTYNKLVTWFVLCKSNLKLDLCLVTLRSQYELQMSRTIQFFPSLSGLSVQSSPVQSNLVQCSTAQFSPGQVWAVQFSPV